MSVRGSHSRHVVEGSAGAGFAVAQSREVWQKLMAFVCFPQPMRSVPGNEDKQVQGEVKFWTEI